MSVFSVFGGIKFIGRQKVKALDAVLIDLHGRSNRGYANESLDVRAMMRPITIGSVVRCLP